MNFPKEALEVLYKLNKAGYQAYLVGGALRDALRGEELGDMDIATSARPQEVMELFKQNTVIPTGLKHGTVTLLYRGLMLEITTFRTEGAYFDHRRPSSVSFSSSLKEDVLRRDFTINALAYHPDEGIIDYVGGLDDLKNGILRSVGSAQQRFYEDALRMVRALRFLSVLGFEIEEKTKKALFQHRLLIKKVSPQRLQMELSKLLMGVQVERVLIDYHEIISVFIPEILPMIGFDQQTPYHCYDVWIHTAKVVALTKRQLKHRLAGLLHDIAKPSCFYVDDRDVGHFPGHSIASAQVARDVMTRLGYSKKIQKEVLSIILHHNTGIYPDDKSIERSLFYWGEEVFFDVLDFKWADNLAKEPAFIRSRRLYEEVEELARDYLKSGPILKYKDLDLSSQELMELDYKGKALGQALEKLVMAVFSGLDNKKEVLIDYLEKTS